MGDTNAEKAESYRPIFDWLRLISCIGIIGLHVTGDRSDPLGIYFQGFFRLWLPMFFLLSGVLILTAKKEENIGGFYLKRVERVVIPFFIYGAYYTCWINQGHAILEVPTQESLLNALRLIPTSWQQTFTGLQYFHLWFMYEIIGLYILMPFLKKGLQAMSDRMLRILMVVILVMMACQDYLPLVGLEFSVDNYFAYWVLYLILGYILMKEFSKRWYVWIAFFGFFTWVQSIRLKLTHYELTEKIGNYFDLSPHMIISVAGTFALFMLLEKVLTKSRIVNRVVHFLAKYTLGIYLIHGYIISWWGVHYGTSNGTVFGTLHTLFFVFLLSLCFALVFDTLITFNAMRGFRWFVNKISEKRRRNVA
ncbi:MAG: acyltransferase [Lachnospiraceae bacterium]|nr:acyltransferase [Lachnospiraceae bacterium]